MKKVITVARYHSLVADPQTIPAELKVTAVTEDGEVMAVEQTEKQIYGVQFHPESVLKMCIRDRHESNRMHRERKI